jgi:hypothetical protein
VGEQGSDLGLPDAGAAVDRDDGAVVGARVEERLQELPQSREDHLRLVDVLLGDLDLVTGHVPGGDGPEDIHPCS